MARVLVIEDEDPLRRIIMMNLVRRAYSVTEAESAAAAREAITCAATVHRPFDVLLLDLNLPDQTGWDVLRWLDGTDGTGRTADGSDPPHRPYVIVMTAVHPAQHRIEEFQPEALLIKPFPIDALVRSVDRAVHPLSSVDAEREAREVSDG